MKKDRVRDYATAAFRDYAKRQATDCAMPSEQQDSAAIELTFDHLESQGKEHIINAVKAVYFAGANERLKIRDISLRVSRFAIEQHADESTVYRWLKEARDLFAKYRGLTL